MRGPQALAREHGFDGSNRPTVRIEYQPSALVLVAGRTYRLELDGECVWITGDLFTGPIEADELEDATAVLATVADELRRRGAEEGEA